MSDENAQLGSAAWVRRTEGWLTPAERRSLVRPLATTHVSNAVGRLRLAARLHPGRHRHIPESVLEIPESPLTRAARKVAHEVLPSTLLRHSYRSYRFARALGEVDEVQVDAELLFAAAMLHDTGLVNPSAGSDFTLASTRLAREVAGQVGLSPAAIEVMESAITMHYSPGVSRAAGSEAYVLAAGASLDVARVRTWDLPAQTLKDAGRDYPRDGFKKTFAQAFRDEATRVPQGRARFLIRYGALNTAIKLGPLRRVTVPFPGGRLMDGGGCPFGDRAPTEAGQTSPRQ